MPAVATEAPPPSPCTGGAEKAAAAAAADAELGGAGGAPKEAAAGLAAVAEMALAGVAADGSTPTGAAAAAATAAAGTDHSLTPVEPALGIWWRWPCATVSPTPPDAVAERSSVTARTESVAARRTKSVADPPSLPERKSPKVSVAAMGWRGMCEGGGDCVDCASLPARAPLLRGRTCILKCPARKADDVVHLCDEPCLSSGRIWGHLCYVQSAVLRRLNRVKLDVHAEKAFPAPVRARDDLDGPLRPSLRVVDCEEDGLANVATDLVGKLVAFVVERHSVC